MKANADYAEKLKSGDYCLEVGPNLIGKKQESKIRKLKPYEKCGIYRGLCYHKNRFDMICFRITSITWMSLVLGGEKNVEEKYKEKIAELKEMAGSFMHLVTRALYEKYLNRGKEILKDKE